MRPFYQAETVPDFTVMIAFARPTLPLASLAMYVMVFVPTGSRWLDPTVTATLFCSNRIIMSAFITRNAQSGSCLLQLKLGQYSTAF